MFNLLWLRIYNWSERSIRRIVIGRLKLPMELWCESDGVAFASKLAVCPIALNPLILGKHKHDHDFLSPFPFENAKAIMAV